MRRIVLCLSIAVSMAPVSAATPEYVSFKEVCRKPSTATKSVCSECQSINSETELKHLQKLLNDIENKIENIPPIEAEYLNVEGNPIVGRQRWQLAYRNKYFPAWSLRKDIGRARTALNALTSNEQFGSLVFPYTEKNMMLAKFRKGLELARAMYSVRDSFNLYTERDKLRAPPVLTGTESDDISSSFPWVAIWIDSYLSCVEAQLKEYERTSP